MSFRCDRLCKSFGGIRVLADVQIQFPATGITAIIGPNGAGKTTLLNVLTGFVRPDMGRCFLDERETTHLAAYQIAQRGVARTFQDLRLIFQIPVLDNVLLARPSQIGESLLGAVLRLSALTEEACNREVAMKLIKFVGLEDKAQELAGDLSYGQQKLLTIACCLATEARILLLDEPAAGVHPEMVSQIIGLLRQLRDQGKLVVFIEHDIAVVRQTADHVVFMDEGKVIAEGSPHEVLDRPEIMEAYLG